MNQPGRKQQDEFRAAVTMTVVWVAGLTLIIIFVGLFAGMLLDKFLNSKPLFTIIMTIVSITMTFIVDVVDIVVIVDIVVYRVIVG